GDTNYWFESSPTTDVTIRNCRFIGNRARINSCPEYSSTDNAPYYHSGIKVVNNTFDSREPITLRQTKDIIFKDNKHSDGSNNLFVRLENCEKFN
ncbi:MAG: hypothetical protein IKU45_04335, partial [Clostridia bacterium]|nr:hypothetical protein [Clostridia bacterium]